MRVSALLFGLSFLGGAAPAAAQTWPICFEGEAILTPESYVAFREAHAAFTGAGPFRASVTLHVPLIIQGAAPRDARVDEAYLEAIRTGFGGGVFQIDRADDRRLEPGCLSLEVTTVAASEPPIPPALWHLRGAYFEPGGVEFSEAGLSGIRIAAAMNAPGRARYRLDGHTDTAGSAEANMELSRRRVVAYAEELVRRGVRWEDIEMSWYGETRLARPTADGVSEPLNRRVWIDLRIRPATPG